MEMTFDEKYVFTSNAKRNLLIILVVGVVLLAVGIFMNMGGGHEAVDAGHHASVAATDNLVASTEAVASEGEEGGHHETATWLKRVHQPVDK